MKELDPGLVWTQGERDKLTSLTKREKTILRQNQGVTNFNVEGIERYAMKQAVRLGSTYIPFHVMVENLLPKSDFTP